MALSDARRRRPVTPKFSTRAIQLRQASLQSLNLAAHLRHTQPSPHSHGES